MSNAKSTHRQRGEGEGEGCTQEASAKHLCYQHHKYSTVRTTVRLHTMANHPLGRVEGPEVVLRNN